MKLLFACLGSMMLTTAILEQINFPNQVWIFLILPAAGAFVFATFLEEQEENKKK